MNDIQAEIERHKTLLTTLYTDLKDGILSQDEYAYAKSRYNDELTKLEKEYDELKSVRSKATKADTGEKKWNRLIAQYYQADTLTPSMLKALVKEIRLYSDNSISIEFCYMDEFEEMLRECERIRKEVA